MSGNIPQQPPTPEQALAEFTAAVQVWFQYMDQETKRKAFEIVEARTLTLIHARL